MELPPPFSRWRRTLRPSFAKELPPGLRTPEGRTLPDDASLRLFDRLASGLAPRDVDAVRAACTPDSLDRWLLASVNAWEEAGGPATEAWVFRGLAAFGKDAVVRAVGRRIERWAKAKHIGWSVHGITVLTNAGSDLAVLTLTRLAQAANDGRVREEASNALERLASARGVPREELEEAALPQLGFEEGRARLSYGPRQFDVELDEHLVPWVVVDGARQAKAPAARKSDDPDEAKEARALFRSWTLELASITRTRLRMLEEAMRTERRWSRDELVARWVEPAIVRPLTRRVLFTTSQGVCFRVDDDGTFATVDDETLTLDAADLVGVAHPLPIAEEERARWRRVFEDYALLPAFPQLDRDVHAWPEDSLADSVDPRFRGQLVHPARLRRLTELGWRERGWGGAVRELTLALPENVAVHLRFEPGYVVTDLGRSDARVELDDVALEGRRVDFGDLSPVVRSELARDLASLHALLPA
ncbi:MAG: DUF4132 domain-containing protein [Polyangiales bacterium]|nr:DUF4132 domain-containing protein [Myxococcales bacterium]MCB9622132.1 DUF4132 domain-containing protein [Sandaracinus sp.]